MVQKHEERRKVSSIRIRKTLPKPQNNLTPMGLPKPIRYVQYINRYQVLFHCLKRATLTNLIFCQNFSFVMLCVFTLERWKLTVGTKSSDDDFCFPGFCLADL